MDKNFDEEFKELQKRYLNKIRDSLSSFKDLIEESPINIQEIYSRVHAIAGTSGMYELLDLSNISSDFEGYLKPIKENPDSVKIEEFRNKFSSYLVSVEKILLGE